MSKECDKFLELSLAEEELISGGFINKIGRAVKSTVRFVTRKDTWRTTGQVLGTIGKTAGTLVGAVTIFLPKK